MIALRAVLLILAAGLVGFIVWAMGEADLFASFAEVMADPWGAVAIADLYLGFFVFAVILFILQRSPLAATSSTVALLLLGNVVSAVYLAVRGLQRLRG